MGIGSLGRTWHETDIPGQASRVAVVTGANAGIGLRIATVLAERGATVVLACRDTKRAERAAEIIRAGHPAASVAVVRLDLASLVSVREAADEIRARYSGLALLINNAGVMEPPFTQTVDGFELTFATNHLGHFALTGLLLDQLRATSGSRVVTMSSMAHLDGVPDFDGPDGDQDYDAEAAYAQSKLANVMFSYELDRRLRSAGSLTMALAAHPGVALTALFHTRSR